MSSHMACHWSSYASLILSYIPENMHNSFIDWVATSDSHRVAYEKDGLEAIALFVKEVYELDEKRA